MASRSSKESNRNNNERVEAGRDRHPNRKVGSFGQERQEDVAAIGGEGAERAALVGQIDGRTQTCKRNRRLYGGGSGDESTWRR